MLTITLICTAAFPRIAGAIRRKIWRSPGCDQSNCGRNRNPSAMQARHLPQQLQRSAEHHADTPCLRWREMPSCGPTTCPRIRPEIDGADVEERRCHCGHAELVARVQHAHRLRRQSHQQQERKHDARHRDREFEFAGYSCEAGSEQLNQRRDEDDTERRTRARPR